MTRILYVAIAFSLASFPVQAQTTVRTTWSELASVVGKRDLRVVQTDGSVLQGRIRNVDADGVAMRIRNARGGNDDVRVQRGQIRTLSFQKGRGAGRTVGIIAAVSAAGALAVFGALGAALDAKDAAIGGFTGAAGAAAAATILAVTGGDRRVEIIVEP
jgi:hypothetical protein